MNERDDISRATLLRDSAPQGKMKLRPLTVGAALCLGRLRNPLYLAMSGPVVDANEASKERLEEKMQLMFAEQPEALMEMLWVLGGRWVEVRQLCSAVPIDKARVMAAVIEWSSQFSAADMMSAAGAISAEQEATAAAAVNVIPRKVDGDVGQKNGRAGA